MKILVLNCGSSSLKYQLIDMQTEEVLASGKYERIGEQEAFITHKACGKKVTINHVALDHTEAIDFTLKQLTNSEYKVIELLTNKYGNYIIQKILSICTDKNLFFRILNIISKNIITINNISFGKKILQKLIEKYPLLKELINKNKS